MDYPTEQLLFLYFLCFFKQYKSIFSTFRLDALVKISRNKFHDIKKFFSVLFCFSFLMCNMLKKFY